MLLARKRVMLQPGLTLMEIMAVLFIIAIFAAVAVPAYLSYIERSKRQRVRSDIRVIKTALTTYNMDTNRWPETLEDLVRPPFDEKIKSKWVPGGYLSKDEVPEDPWGSEYAYRHPGDGRPYDLFSYGPNGESAPEDEWMWE